MAAHQTRKTGFSSDQNRRSKAEKIKIILAEFINNFQGRQLMLLDVGTGSGEIAYYLSDYFRVISIDINDQRLFHDGFEFLVTSEVLPFASNVFDIVISNHVIEHVNSTHTHISEIHRVLKPEGWLYLATPNRLWPWEVHYRVPLIHYLPRDFFHWLMRKAGKYQEDIDLQTSWQLEFNCRKYFLISSVSENICQNPRYYKLNVSERLNQALNVVPKSIIKVAHCLMPTLIYMMQKKNAKKNIMANLQLSQIRRR